MQILKIQIIKGFGSDFVSLQTDFPCPFIPESQITQNLCLDFKTSYDTAEQYVKENFPNIPVEVINR